MSDRGPIDWYVYIDTSYSMHEDERLDHAVKAVRLMMAKVQPQDRLEFSNFASMVRTVLPLVRAGQATRATFEASLKDFKADGSTVLLDALVHSMAQCARNVESSDIERVATVVVVTDGEDTASQKTLEECKRALQRAGDGAFASVYLLHVGGTWDANNTLRAVKKLKLHNVHICAGATAAKDTRASVNAIVRHASAEAGLCAPPPAPAPPQALHGHAHPLRPYRHSGHCNHCGGAGSGIFMGCRLPHCDYDECMACYTRRPSLLQALDATCRPIVGDMVRLLPARFGAPVPPGVLGVLAEHVTGRVTGVAEDHGVTVQVGDKSSAYAAAHVAPWHPLSWRPREGEAVQLLWAGAKENPALGRPGQRRVGRLTKDDHSDAQGLGLPFRVSGPDGRENWYTLQCLMPAAVGACALLQPPADSAVVSAKRDGDKCHVCLKDAMGPGIANAVVTCSEGHRLLICARCARALASSAAQSGTPSCMSGGCYAQLDLSSLIGLLSPAQQSQLIAAAECAPDAAHLVASLKEQSASASAANFSQEAAVAEARSWKTAPALQVAVSAPQVAAPQGPRASASAGTSSFEKRANLELALAEARSRLAEARSRVAPSMQGPSASASAATHFLEAAAAEARSLVAAPAPAPHVAAPRGPPSSASAVTRSLEAVEMRSRSEAGRRECLAAGAAEACMAALRAHAGEPGVCRAACQALGNLAARRDGQNACSSLGAFEACAETLHVMTSMGAASACEQACRALAAMAVCAPGSRAGFKALRRIAECLESLGQSSSSVCEMASWAVLNICSAKQHLSVFDGRRLFGDVETLLQRLAAMQARYAGSRAGLKAGAALTALQMNLSRGTGRTWGSVARGGGGAAPMAASSEGESSGSEDDEDDDVLFDDALSACSGASCATMAVERALEERFALNAFSGEGSAGGGGCSSGGGGGGGGGSVGAGGASLAHVLCTKCNRQFQAGEVHCPKDGTVRARQ